jgi:exodeoxyribonuclease VII large subunit
MMQTLSVSTLISQIKKSLEGSFRTVVVEGEITNLSRSATGHWYFTLSDRNSSISCALFKMDAMRNSIIKTLKDGDKIIISGPISVYAARGTFQILAKKIVHSGAGGLIEKFEKLKIKLKNEGLFDIQYKKSIPKFPKKVALITADQSAAMADFLNVVSKKDLFFSVVIIPTLMQGAQSSKSVIGSINRALALKDVDVIVISRGGGSLEDLWSFNDELLARCIFNSKIPIISAVGHQSDFTISDYVCDLRASTPTAAGEYLISPHQQIDASLKYAYSTLKQTIKNRLDRNIILLKDLSPQKNIFRLTKKIDTYKNSLENMYMLKRPYELLGVKDKAIYLDDLIQRATRALEQKVSNHQANLNTFSKQLDALSPKQVLERGYSILKDSSNKVITNSIEFNKILEDDTLKIDFYDSQVEIKKVTL